MSSEDYVNKRIKFTADDASTKARGYGEIAGNHLKPTRDSKCPSAVDLALRFRSPKEA